MYPIMKSNYIYVQALEEFPPNPEFAGRNFNAGEVVQLVIKDRAGRWLPLRHVQMVMVHELAHCKQMNHSRFFWEVRNKYAEELRELWRKGYAGEGLWGRGRSLHTGTLTRMAMPEQSLLPENLCGGTYRSRGKKRKRGGEEKPKLSYAERQQRRILKKFGTEGVVLGEDEEEKAKLEAGKKTKGKPKVANSARGRELRAAAALARFEKAKEKEVKKEECGDSETESEYEWPPSDENQPNRELATDLSGYSFVRVCEDEDAEDVGVKREMQELLNADRDGSFGEISRIIKKEEEEQQPHNQVNEADTSTESESEPESVESKKPNDRRTLLSSDTESIAAEFKTHHVEQSPADTIECPACSLANEKDTLMCVACSNVLQPDKMPNHWRCESLACRGGLYLNMGDYSRCQICGAEKPAAKN